MQMYYTIKTYNTEGVSLRKTSISIPVSKRLYFRYKRRWSIASWWFRWTNGFLRTSYYGWKLKAELPFSGRSCFGSFSYWLRIKSWWQEWIGWFSINIVKEWWYVQFEIWIGIMVNLWFCFLLFFSLLLEAWRKECTNILELQLSLGILRLWTLDIESLLYRYNYMVLLTLYVNSLPLTSRRLLFVQKMIVYWSSET